MFIVEDGNGAFGGLEDADDFVEEAFAGVLALAFGVDGIIAVFADGEDGVDGELVLALAEGFGDGGIDGDFIFFGDCAADVSVWGLIEIEGDDFAWRVDEATVEEVGFEEVFEDDVGVASIGELGDDGGDFEFLRGVVGMSTGGIEDWGGGERRGGFQEMST